MIKRFAVIITLLAILVLAACGDTSGNGQGNAGMGNVPNAPAGTTPPETPSPTPTTPEPPTGNQPPTGMVPEPEDLFAFQFMTIEQLNWKFRVVTEVGREFPAVVEFEQAGVIITGYYGDLSQVMIPDTIGGFPVVAISADTFPLAILQNGQLTVMPVTDIFFPPTVRAFSFGKIQVIGEVPQPFPTNLPESLVVPHGVTHFTTLLQEQIFSATRSVMLPDTLKVIGDGTFANFTSLTSITIPDSVEKIGWGAFHNTRSLLSINMPDSYVSISHKRKQPKPAI